MANKFSKFSALALLAVLGLTACESDDIVAEMSTYDDALVEKVDGSPIDIYNNCLDTIYDAYRKGALASDVLDQVLYNYSISVLGRYNKSCGTAGDNEVTLTEVITKSDAEIKAFIDAHKAYQSMENGERKADAFAEEKARLLAKVATINDRVAEKMYSKISSGSYSERNRFSEEKFLRSLGSAMKNVEKTFTAANTYENVLLSPSVEPKDVFAHFLHKENYSNEEKGYNYIEEEIIPEIYVELLNEQYILDKSYTSLGRSYARKVNVLKISKNSDYDLADVEMMNYFINSMVSATPKGAEDADITDLANSVNGVGLEDFKAISTAWTGVLGDSSDPISAKAEAALTYVVSKGAMKKVDSDPTNVYYEGTDYGAVMKEYAKVADVTNIKTEDNDAWNSFTNSGKYPVATGLQIKKDEVALKDYVTNGWFSKSELSDLPSAIRTQLFDTNLANEIDRATDRFAYDGANWVSSKANDNEATPNVCKINGSYFLKKSTTEGSTKDSDNSDILFSDSGAYYVVQIEYAISPAKFNRTVDVSKLRETASKPYATDLMEANINEVNKIIAKEDSVVKLSKQYWLEQMSIEYHDTVIYDYFKTNYPDLFEDED